MHKSGKYVNYALNWVIPRVWRYEYIESKKNCCKRRCFKNTYTDFLFQQTVHYGVKHRQKQYANAQYPGVGGQRKGKARQTCRPQTLLFQPSQDSENGYDVPGIEQNIFVVIESLREEAWVQDKKQSAQKRC
jgi:hypothetical protein